MSFKKEIQLFISCHNPLKGMSVFMYKGSNPCEIDRYINEIVFLLDLIVDSVYLLPLEIKV